MSISYAVFCLKKKKTISFMEAHEVTHEHGNKFATARHFHVEISVGHNVLVILFFFFNDTATTEIYTLSLHDALPIRMAIIRTLYGSPGAERPCGTFGLPVAKSTASDRKSTRLNSSHMSTSYAVF